MAGGGGDGTVELFRFIQKTYQDIGIIPPRPNENHCSFNAKKWYFLFCLAQFFISAAAYLLFEANSIIEYGMVFYTCSTTVFSSVVYLILIWQRENILDFIANCEGFIQEKSEYFSDRGGGFFFNSSILSRNHFSSN